MKGFWKRISLLAIMSAVGIGVPDSQAHDPVTIVFLTWKPNQPSVWKGIIENFHQHNPGIRVSVQIGPHSSTEYHAIVTQRLKNRDASVDVFFMDVIWPPEFANAGWAMDLTSRFPVQEQKKFLAGPIAANTYKDRIFGVPCYLAAGLLYYRKDLLSTYGFKPPRTWDQMLTQGRATVLGEGDPALHIYSGQFKQYEGLVCNMMEFIWSNGGSIIDRKTGRAVLDQLSGVEAVRFVRDRIVAEAAPRGVINYEEPESLDLFLQGKAVFHRNWPYAWTMAHDAQRSKIAGKIGVGPLPSFKNHWSASTLGGWQFAINRYSNQPEAARRFIEFMTSHQTQKRLALAAGLAPTRRSVYQDPEVLKKMPHLQAFLPAFKRARPRPLSPVYPMISQELQRYFSKAIVNKGSDLSGLARKARTKIQRLLELESMIRR